HPLLSAPQWCDVLHTHGFQQATSIDCAQIHQSMIMARAEGTPDEDCESEHWLIFADSGKTGRHLAVRVRASGSTCTLVYSGSQFMRTTDDAFTIDPYQAEHYQRLCAELGTATLHHCVYLWSLDAMRQSDDTTSLVSRSQLIWESTLLMVQALGKAGLAPRLALITRGAVSVSGEAVPGIAMSL